MSAASSTPPAPTVYWTYTDGDVVVDGLRLHYRQARRADSDASSSPSPSAGRTLLALHGMSSYGGAWRAALPHLNAVDRVICPDFRGHGQSDWTTEGYWLRDYAADTLALADQLDLGRVDLIGHSLGARVAMILAPQLGDRLRTVSFSDTGPEVSRAGALKAQAASASASTASSFRDEEAIRAALRADHPDWVQEAIDTRAHELYRPNWADRWVHRGDPEVTYLLGRAGLRETADMWAGLAAITAPALLVRGMQSYLLDDELAARMCQALANPTYVQLDLSHEMLYVRPDIFASCVNSFLAQH